MPLWPWLEKMLLVPVLLCKVLAWPIIFLRLVAFCVLEAAFYVSPLVLIASTWAVIYRELYRAFRASKSIQPGSLRQFAKMRNLVDEYLPAHGRACTRQHLRAAMDHFAANTECGFHADFFPRILRLPSDEVLGIANECEDRATQATRMDDVAECEKHLLRHVAAFLRRRVLTRPERINPVEHPLHFLLHTPYALAGILAKYILRLPSLKHLEHPVHFAYFLPFLLTIPGAFLLLHLVRLARLAHIPPHPAATNDLVPSLFAIIGIAAFINADLSLRTQRRASSSYAKLSRLTLRSSRLSGECRALSWMRFSSLSS
ncbi:hypothetical protein JCM8547_002909 [Rhodosporidiobolus lusitaniae]